MKEPDCLTPDPRAASPEHSGDSVHEVSILLVTVRLCPPPQCRATLSRPSLGLSPLAHPWTDSHPSSERPKDHQGHNSSTSPPLPVPVPDPLGPGGPVHFSRSPVNRLDEEGLMSPFYSKQREVRAVDPSLRDGRAGGSAHMARLCPGSMPTPALAPGSYSCWR